MAFPEKIRGFWMNVTDGKCQQEFYTEERGWEECGRPAKHVHHITPERWTHEVIGKEADDNLGIPLCEHHHVGVGDEEHSRDFSYHPDMDKARAGYRDWKQNRDRLEVKLEKRITRDAYPSPYDEAVEDHQRATENGERYWQGTPEIEEHYEEKMETKAVIYQATTGKKKPHTKRRSKRYKEKGHWVDKVYER